MKNAPFFFVILVACTSPKKPMVIEEVSLGAEVKSDYPMLLSEWGLFEGEIKKLDPAENVFPYEINSPLFSDYAHKARFIKLPKGGTMSYRSNESFGFPVGTVLVKNFFYPIDFSKPKGERIILETRLLIHEENEWQAVVYQWNEDQTEANQIILGETVAMEWSNEKGELQRVNYSIPSKPQCKSCHDFNGKIKPIGTLARQLNSDHQLEDWIEGGKLAVAEVKNFPKLVAYDDDTELVNDRARAWLEINCAHCHRREGPAKNSGLYLQASQTENFRLGVNKAPIAAGKGSGGLKYSIVPRQPDQSILVHRIESLAPGEMMPELGRSVPHSEGIELIKQWIKEMKSE